MTAFRSIVNDVGGEVDFYTSHLNQILVEDPAGNPGELFQARG